MSIVRFQFLIVSTLFFCACVAILGTPSIAAAQTASELETQINERNRQIADLEAEIARYQKELDVLGSKKSTLQSAVNSLTLSQKQLAAQIEITKKKIAAANIEIQRLTLSIGDKEETIAANKDAIAKALRSLAQGEQTPLIEQLMSSDSLSEAWSSADQVYQFNKALGGSIRHLQTARTELANNREKELSARQELVKLQNDLTTQKRSVDASKAAQQQLLAQTRNQESNYQKLIAQKQAAEKAFEQELINLQGQLHLIVNPNLLPKVGSGVLRWPFSLSFMQNCANRKSVFGNIFCITQYFGNTAFSTANPQIYNGNGHNAIDISAPIGTPVRSAGAGTVLATGNTDAYPGCYSFGKWVMVVHGNGLNTLYSHLSTIDVSAGQSVESGQVVGLAGMTGYATGPHLHFGVYATQGTQIMTLRQFRGAKNGCANAPMPVATLNAYLNPLSYL